MGIYKENKKEKKGRKHAFNHESDQEKKPITAKKKRKKTRSRPGNKIEEKTITSRKKKEGNGKRELE